MDFIDDSIVSDPHAMKWVAAFHLCFCWCWRDFSQIFNFSCDPFLVHSRYGHERLCSGFGKFNTEDHRLSFFLSSSQETVSPDSDRACHASSISMRSSMEEPLMQLFWPNERTCKTNDEDYDITMDIAFLRDRLGSGREKDHGR